MIKNQLKKDLEKVLSKLGIAEEVEVTRTAREKFGDFSTNLALRLAQGKPSKTSIRDQSSLEIAKILTYSLKKQPYIKKLEVVEPGFVNFFVKDEIWQNETEELLAKKEFKLNLENKKILVEFAHPNTHKIFHIGHLRNITTGEAICRLLEAVGNKVFRVNYQGDIGLHIAKALWGIKKLGLKKPKSLAAKIEFLSKAYILGNQAYDEDEANRSEIEQINVGIYRKDKELLSVWQETKNWSLQYFGEIYKRVGTQFERLYFESEVANLGQIEVSKFAKRGVFKKSKGAIIFPGEKFGLHNRVFVTAQGLPTYEAKDVGLAKLQFGQYLPDLIIHVVGPEQKDYFEVLFKVLEQLYPKTRGKELHLIYGWVRLATGRMSSRKGEVVASDWLLDEAKKKALAILKSSHISKDVDEKDVSEKVAVGAVKYSFLKMGLVQDLVFDFEKSLNLSGDSGPYLQYTHARCQSVLEKAGAKVGRVRWQDAQEEEGLILRSLGHFGEVVVDSAKDYSPNILASYLYEVAQKYNGFYNRLPILKAPGPARSRRLFLTKATAYILSNGLYLLGIPAPAKM